MALLDEIREACAGVAARARHVAVQRDRIAAYASGLGPARAVAPADPEVIAVGAPAEALAALVLCLDAVNFGSGWSPTLRKAPGRSGYFTVALALRARFDADVAWFTAARLCELEVAEIAAVMGQDPDHELMARYAAALRELGQAVADEHRGRFLGVVEAAAGSAERLVEILAAWPGWRDACVHDGLSVPLYKRAQLAACDLHGAGLLAADDLGRLTLFADNLVPHVLRVDGLLRYSPELAARIEAGELLAHCCAEEVEIRACALHAVELMVRAGTLCAAQIDGILWRRGGQPRYKARPRHRARSSAY